MFDVAIVGGGIAGCSAAIHLAAAGARVVLLEAKSYPHHKVCGEFLSPECVYLLDQLGLLPALRQLNPVAIDSVWISAPSQAVWKAHLPAEAIGISRYALDEMMAQRASALGVDVRPHTTVEDIRGSLKKGFGLLTRTTSTQTQVRARVVIAAYGKRGSLDRVLRRPFLQQPQPFVALKSHFYGPPTPRRVELHAFEGGYCGVSEIENGQANVCLLVRQEVFQKAGSIPAFVQWMQTQNRYLRSWLTQAEPIYERWLSISQVPFTHKSPVENDILLVGDSARLIAPLAGDGMAMAFHSGQMAAEHTARYLSGDLSGGGLLHVYSTDWQQVFEGRLRMARALQTLMLRPALLAPGLRLLNAVPAVGQYLINQTRDMRFIVRQESI